MKKIINLPENALQEMLEGFRLANPDLIQRIKGFDVFVRKTVKTGKVAIVSGGGSGHEPAHAGFIGEGMLDAAICGSVFTAPTPDQIFKAIQTVATEQGVLLIVNNYSGDIMNFEMAMELANAEGIFVDKVIVDDDVAVQNNINTTGRRGIAGTFLVQKIAGAAAEQGMPLHEVKRVAKKAVDNLRSMGVALSSCIVPESGKPNFTLAQDEMEIGMGVHGEPGVEKTKLKTADEISDILLSKILAEMHLFPGSEVALLVNGLGSTPLMELYIVNRAVQTMLSDKGIEVYHTNVGNYMTSLEMAGLSISVLMLDEELKNYYKAKSDTPAYKSFGWG